MFRQLKMKLDAKKLLSKDVVFDHFGVYKSPNFRMEITEKEINVGGNSARYHVLNENAIIYSSKFNVAGLDKPGKIVDHVCLLLFDEDQCKVIICTNYVTDDLPDDEMIPTHKRILYSWYFINVPGDGFEDDLYAVLNHKEKKWCLFWHSGYEVNYQLCTQRTRTKK